MNGSNISGYITTEFNKVFTIYIYIQCLPIFHTLKGVIMYTKQKIADISSKKKRDDKGFRCQHLNKK